MSVADRPGDLHPPPPRFAWRQFAAITAGALAIFFLLRRLPTGTNLNHMDFRVDPRDGRAIEFCDPVNPQFIPVVAVRSPVTMTLETGGPPVAGLTLQGILRLRTGSGKAIAPADLLVTHTRRLHLLVIDPTLADYRHVHPEPGRQPGTWTFSFTPHRVGEYRVFADFTPVATGRGLYAGADLPVAPGPEPVGEPAPRPDGRVVERDGYRFELVPAEVPLREGRPIRLAFKIMAQGGGAVPLRPVMDALAHLVTFDEARSGFAHLHPLEPGAEPPDPARPVMNFQVTIPRAGHYVIWAQINIAGRETFVPFAIEVEEVH